MFLAGCNQNVLLRSVYTLQFELNDDDLNPDTEVGMEAYFRKPGGDTVHVSGFYDGNGIYKIRAYCGEIGRWKYYTTSHSGSLNERNGSFVVRSSTLPGKLRQHSADHYQFMYDNGDWFLHIGDTGYRYLVDSEKMWQAYLDQSVQMGATKIRCWFARSRHTVEALFNEERSDLNLSYWQEMEKRLDYALEKYPHIIFQLIPFAEDDQELLRFSKGDIMSRKVIETVQARWSAYPNVTFCISNDRNINGNQEIMEAVRSVGEYMNVRESWGTLITNHQKRYQGYAFAKDHWSDVITIEDIDQVDGRKVREYRALGADPVVLDEDRYENWRNPANDRYFFRRLMWANLLSGGHPTYGGIRTYESFSDTLTPRGMMGYYDANNNGLLEMGAHDFVHIHKFFSDKDLDLVNWVPSDSLTGNDPVNTKCARNRNDYIIYLQNPDDRINHATANVSDSIPETIIDLEETIFLASWFCPRSGTWYETDTIRGEKQTRLVAPGGEDWVLFLAMMDEIILPE